MKTYRAEQVYGVSTGSVGLTPEQSARRLRSAAVAHTKTKGVFTVLKRFDFKAGEVFRWDGEPMKSDPKLSEVSRRGRPPGNGKEADDAAAGQE